MPVAKLQVVTGTSTAKPLDAVVRARSLASVAATAALEASEGRLLQMQREQIGGLPPPRKW